MYIFQQLFSFNQYHTPNRLLFVKLVGMACLILLLCYHAVAVLLTNG